MLDSLFFADSPGVDLFRTKFMPQSGYDPVDLLAALIPVTSHIGLLATASTTYSSPWDLARRFATLDHLSDGRAGWNIVTTTSPIAAGNFADRPHPPHADRYARAEEFVEAVVKVWDAWEDDAVVASLESGIWADPGKVHPPATAASGSRSRASCPSRGRRRDIRHGPGGLVGCRRRPRRALRRRRLHPAADDRRGGGVPRAHARIGRAARPIGRRHPGAPGAVVRARQHRGRGEAAWDELQAASSEEFRRLNLAHVAGVDQALAAAVDPDGPFPYELFEAHPRRRSARRSTGRRGRAT